MAGDVTVYLIGTLPTGKEVQLARIDASYRDVDVNEKHIQDHTVFTHIDGDTSLEMSPLMLQRFTKIEIRASVDC